MNTLIKVIDDTPIPTKAKGKYEIGDMVKPERLCNESLRFLAEQKTPGSALTANAKRAARELGRRSANRVAKAAAKQQATAEVVEEFSLAVEEFSLDDA